MHTLTCRTCALPAATCPTRDALKKSVAGLGITSVRHRCRDYRPAFLPGDAVRVSALAWPHRDEDDPPPRLDFPGHFIQLVGTKALVFVPKDAEDLNGEGVGFEPMGGGYLKVSLARVAHRDAEPADVTACTWCGAIPGVGNPCGRDPHYTPDSRCLVRQAARSDTKEAAA